MRTLNDSNVNKDCTFVEYDNSDYMAPDDREHRATDRVVNTGVAFARLNIRYVLLLMCGHG